MTNATAGPAYQLTLYVDGASPHSMRAVANVRHLCDEIGSGAQLEVVDVRAHPELVLRDQILAVPTLVKRYPGPTRFLVGDLSDAQKALDSLDLADPVEPDRTAQS